MFPSLAVLGKNGGDTGCGWLFGYNFNPKKNGCFSPFQDQLATLQGLLQDGKVTVPLDPLVETMRKFWAGLHQQCTLKWKSSEPNLHSLGCMLIFRDGFPGNGWILVAFKVKLWSASLMPCARVRLRDDFRWNIFFSMGWGGPFCRAPGPTKEVKEGLEFYISQCPGSPGLAVYFGMGEFLPEQWKKTWLVGLYWGWNTTHSRWWFQTFFIFTPTWGDDPFWLLFFNWVETTNKHLYRDCNKPIIRLPINPPVFHGK